MITATFVLLVACALVCGTFAVVEFFAADGWAAFAWMGVAVLVVCGVAALAIVDRNTMPRPVVEAP